VCSGIESRFLSRRKAPTIEAMITIEMNGSVASMSFEQDAAVRNQRVRTHDELALAVVRVLLSPTSRV